MKNIEDETSIQTDDDHNQICKCGQWCETFIGYGDHKIKARVELFPWTGPGYDFAVITFWVGNVPMRIAGTSSSRICLDDVGREREAVLHSGEEPCLQTLHVKLSFSPQSERAYGGIVADCLCLTDTFGRSPQRFIQRLANWKGLSLDCPPYLSETNSIPCELPLGRDYIIKTTIYPFEHAYHFHSASIDFLYRNNAAYLVKDYKLGKRLTDPIFLDSQHRTERDVMLFSQGDDTPRVYICKLHLTLPQQGSRNGFICIDVYYVENSVWWFWENLIIAEWDPSHNASCLLRPSGHY